MQGFARILLGSSAAAALVAGATMLSTTQASAQINIEGLIRGAMSHGYNGGGTSYRGHHGKVHEARHEHEHHSKNSKEANDEDKGKQDNEDKQDKQSAQANEGNHNNQAEDKGPPQSSPPANTSAQRQPAPDVPAFSPSR
jgi:hypothetical protein